jgi:hypothetical protein
VRRNPEKSVQAFLASAAKAWKKTRGDLPPDWGKAGDLPELPREKPGIVVWVRNDRLMYRGLVGSDRIEVTAEEARKMSGGEWPQAVFGRFAKTFHPRGEVLIRIEDWRRDISSAISSGPPRRASSYACGSSAATRR